MDFVGQQPHLNGVSCIKGEIHSLVTLMRLHTRWSQNKRGGISGSSSTAVVSSSSSSSSSSGYREENAIMRSFRKLNEYLEGIFDLREVDCVVYLTPFHEVIVSENASGLLTSASLSSISKFVSYGFLCPGFPRVREGIALIANCISRCVFEESDWESDEVILMKLLELSTLTLRCDASSLLTVGAAWEMYSTCIAIHSQYRASKILRSEAETALRNLTLTTFSRAYNALALARPPPAVVAGAGAGDQSSRGGNSHSNGGGDAPALVAPPPPAAAVAVYMIPPGAVAVDLKGKTLTWERLSQAHTFDGPMGVALLLAKVRGVVGRPCAAGSGQRGMPWHSVVLPPLHYPAVSKPAASLTLSTRSPSRRTGHDRSERPHGPAGMPIYRPSIKAPYLAPYLASYIMTNCAL